MESLSFLLAVDWLLASVSCRVGLTLGKPILLESAEEGASTEPASKMGITV